MPRIERMQLGRRFAVWLFSEISNFPLVVFALGCLLYLLHLVETSIRAVGKVLKRRRADLRLPEDGKPPVSVVELR
jgi:hypothetical protein